MSFINRGARAAARPLRQSVFRQQRRLDSHHAGHGHDHGHGESALHVAGGPGSESFGMGFYIGVALIPTSLIIYSMVSGRDNFVNQLIKSYEEDKKVVRDRNTIHTTMMEQALNDRQLFKYQPRDTSGPDMRFPEAFNSGSPWNVSAGQGGADLSALAKHYEEKHSKQEEARLQRRKDGKVVTIYED